MASQCAHSLRLLKQYHGRLSGRPWTLALFACSACKRKRGNDNNRAAMPRYIIAK